MVSSKIKKNAEKLVFLASQYPDHTFNQLLAMFQLPAIDVNTAIWYAVESGWLEDPKATGMDKTVKVLKRVPVNDKDVTELEDMIVYGFSKLEDIESDMEENYLTNWLMGYPTHDIFIAMKRLEGRKIIATYDIKDGDSVYTFFTLYWNLDKRWGEKQYRETPKEEPITKRSKRIDVVDGDIEQPKE